MHLPAPLHAGLAFFQALGEPGRARRAGQRQLPAGRREVALGSAVRPTQALHRVSEGDLLHTPRSGCVLGCTLGCAFGTRYGGAWAHDSFALSGIPQGRRGCGSHGKPKLN
eukprot:366328-Chlamydomonas_euryale.AAC.13